MAGFDGQGRGELFAGEGASSACLLCISPPLFSPQPTACPPPSARRASGARWAAAGRERAGGTAGGGAWTTG